jgi:hypothetical protein
MFFVLEENAGILIPRLYHDLFLPDAFHFIFVPFEAV